MLPQEKSTLTKALMESSSTLITENRDSGLPVVVEDQTFSGRPTPCRCVLKYGDLPKTFWKKRNSTDLFGAFVVQAQVPTSR